MSTFPVVQRPLDKAGNSFVEVRREDGHGASVSNPSFVQALSPLVPTDYSSIELSYTGADLTGVVYKKGITTVVTLSLEYTNGNLTKVTRL